MLRPAVLTDASVLREVLCALHGVSVLSLAATAKAERRSLLASCGRCSGPVVITEDGFAGLWQPYKLSEVALYLEDFRNACGTLESRLPRA